MGKRGPPQKRVPSSQRPGGRGPRGTDTSANAT
jgi:hypothetical protein